MGGEPLLHPDPGAFVDEAFRICPNSEIYIYTNGSPLKKMTPKFWDSCRNADAIIRVSLYPKNLKTLEPIRELCDHNGVRFMPNQVEHFVRGMNPKGDSDPQSAMNYCRSNFVAHFCMKENFSFAQFPRYQSTTTTCLGK
jgi:hypothetical protein